MTAFQRLAFSKSWPRFLSRIDKTVPIHFSSSSHHRPFQTTMRPLTPADLNPAVANVQYAVRGELAIKAEDYRGKLESKDHGLPFNRVINSNIGNPQQKGLDQPPITFSRQVCPTLPFSTISFPRPAAFPTVNSLAFSGGNVTSCPIRRLYFRPSPIVFLRESCCISSPLTNLAQRRWRAMHLLPWDLSNHSVSTVSTHLDFSSTDVIATLS